MYEGHTADSGDLAVPRDAARGGRAAAMSRRRALAAGRTALAPAHERVRTGFRKAELRAPAAAVDATAVTTDVVAAARLGRVLSMRRRRQLSQGKQALNGGADRAAAAAGAGRPAFIVLRGGAR
jgi:hypothetical protein